MSEDRNAQVVITADSTQYNQSVNQAAKSTDVLNASIGKLSASMDGLMKRSGKKLVMFAAADMAALTGATMIAATLDKQLSTLSATAVNMNKSFSMSQVRSEIRSISREVPLARGEIAQLATSITKLGITTAREVGGMTRSFAAFGAATGESPFALAQGQIGLSRTMGTLIGGTRAISNLNDSVTTLSARGGVGATDILNFAQGIAPTARMAGMSQTDVLGVSTAFTRAGADGGYASNVFSQIINDITRMRSTGSPEIKRYARILGMSDREMGQSSPLQIFDRLVRQVGSTGPNSIGGVRALDALGFDGIRTQKALQALGTEGGFGKWVNEARAAYGSGSAEKGAQAAESNLIDSMEKLRNNFTDIGQSIGEVFLDPITKVAEALVSTFQTFNNTMQPVIKGFGVLAGVVGTLAGAVGTLMQVAGPITSALMARRFLNSTFKQSIGGGWRNRGATTGDLSDPKIAARVAGVDANGRPVDRVGFLNRGIYRMSGWLGRMADDHGVTGGMSGIRTAANLGMMGAGGGIRTLMKWMGQDYAKASMQSGADRVNYKGSGRGPISGFMGGLRGGFGQELFGNRVHGPMTEAEASAPKTFREMASAAKQNIANAKAETMARASSTSNMKMMGVQIKALGAETLKLTGAFMKASSAVGAGLLGAGMRAGGGALWGAAKGAGNWLKGNVAAMGSMALMAGAFDIFQSQSAYADDKNAQRPATMSNGIVAYDTALGKSTDRLLSFSSALEKAEGNLTTKEKNAQGALTAGDLSSRGMSKSEFTNQTVDSLTSTSSAVDWMLSQGNLSADQANLMGEDIYKKFGKADGDTIIRQYLALSKNGQSAKTRGVVSAGFGDAYYTATAGGSGLLGGSYQTVGNVLGGIPLVGDFLGGVFKDAAGGKFLGDDMKAQIGMGVNDVMAKSYEAGESMTSSNRKYRGKYQDAVTSKAITDAFVSQMTNARDVDGAKKAQLIEMLNAFSSAGVTGINTDAFSQGWDFTGKSKEELTAWVQQNILQNTAYGTGAFEGTGSIQDIIDSGKKRKVAASTEETVDVMSKFGKDFRAFAKDFANNKAVQDAIIKHPGDPKYIISSAEALRRQAMANANGNESKAMSMLSSLAASNPLAETQANYAREIIAADVNRRMPTLNLAGKADVLSEKVKAAKEAVRVGSDPNAAENLKAAQDEQKDFIVSIYTAKRDLDRQLERSDEDYRIQKTRSDKDFHRSLQRSEYEHNLQLLYSKRDFHREMRNSDEDYYRNLKYMARDAAKSIYDPFARVQSQSVISAKGLIVNLKDQNQRIRQQTKELDQARALGLSQQAIDMLGLADPAKAQQLHYMLETGGKKWIAELNKTVGERGKAAKDLTMDERNNESLRRMDEQRKVQIKRSQDAYDRALRRGERAYDRSVRISVSDYERGMRRMEKDRQKMLDRARQDFTGYVEDVKMSYKKMLKYVIDSAGGPADAVTKSLKKMLHALDQVKKHPAAQSDGAHVVGQSDGAHVVGQSDGAHVVSMTSIRSHQTRNHRSQIHSSAPWGGIFNNNTNFTGNIKVEAQDPNEMARKLKDRKRLDSLRQGARAPH